MSENMFSQGWDKFICDCEDFEKVPDDGYTGATGASSVVHRVTTMVVYISVPAHDSVPVSVPAPDYVPAPTVYFWSSKIPTRRRTILVDRPESGAVFSVFELEDTRPGSKYKLFMDISTATKAFRYSHNYLIDNLQITHVNHIEVTDWGVYAKEAIGKQKFRITLKYTSEDATMIVLTRAMKSRNYKL